MILRGHVGSLQLNIPWKQLFPTPKKPVIVEIDDVFLVLGPAAAKPYDVEADARARANMRQKAIAAHDTKKKKAESLEDKAKNASFTTKLVTSIVNNLQLNIRRVHVRYEDALTHPGHTFAAGFTIDSLTGTTTNEHWEPTFLTGMPVMVYKLLALNALAVYCDTDTEPLASSETWRAKCQQLIPSSASPVDHQYMMSPITCQVQQRQYKIRGGCGGCWGGGERAA